MDLRNSLSAIKHEASEEFAQASMLQKASLGAFVCTLALEWGTFNEGAIGYVGGNVLRHTHSVVLTAAAAGGVSFTEQSVFGMTAAVGIYNFPRLMGSVREKIVGRTGASNDLVEVEPSSLDPKETLIVSEDDSERPNRVRKSLGRFITAFTIGTSLKSIKDNAVEERSLGENAKNVVVDAGLIGGGVAGIGALAAGATNVGRSLGAQEAASVFVDVISNPLTYLGLFGIKASFDIRKRLVRNKQANLNKNLISE